MRLLNLIGIQKFIVGHDPESSYVLLVNAREVDQFQDDEVLLTNACFICLSNNRLATDSITTLWKKFPSAWWVDLSNNQLHSLDGQYPRALGSLNVSGNALQLATLSNLVHTHILRLHVSTSPELSITSYSTINSMIASILPNVWVINDDFISSFDRREGAGRSDNHLPGEVNSDIVIPSNNLGDRENKLIRAIQNCPTKGKYSDYFRLEILLEEYLQEACYFNCFAQQIALQNNSSHRHINNMPFVDVYALIMLPHRLRLDLTVVLTTSVMFPVPKSLLRDALLITGAQYLCSEDIDQLYQLPAFAKTALVCLLRRVSKKELLEWSTIQQFCPKPYRHMPLAQQKHMYTENAPPALDYLDSRGFQFLRPVKEYLEQAIEVTVTDPAQLHAMVPFSELEIEIISKLPDAPTLSSAAVYFKEKAAEQASGKANNASASYKEWIPFAARHTVLLLTKAPSCPPLTRPQQSKVKQELYFEMLPILRAANMTMNDLDLAFVGPGRDGRMLNAKTATLGPTVKPTSMDAPTAPGGAKIGGSFGKDALNMGANALPFGTGLPRAAPGSVLSWKVQEVPRNYAKAWNMEESRRKTGEQEEQEEEGTAQFTDDLESLPVTAKGGNVFLTSSEAQQLEATTSASLSASPPPPLKVKSYGEFSISQFDFGAPAPLPRNRSFSTGQSPSKLALPASGSNNEEEIEYLMGHLRSPPPRSLSNSQSDHLYRAGGNHESTGHLSASIVVPITNPASPDGSLFSHSTGAGAGDIGMNLDGGQSRYSEGPAASETLSVAESEPFRMLTGAAEEGASPEHTISHTPHHRLPSQQGYSQQVTAQNRHSATAASATTMATRPEYVSGALAKPILGFSADANWSSKFLLASPSAVAQANFTVGRADPANTWNFIEYAPVLVHTPAARLSRETLRELSASVACRTAAGDGVTRSVVNGMSDTSQERQAGHAAHGLVLTDSLESRSKIPPGGAKDTAEDALEAHQVDPDADSNAEAGAADPSVHTEESSFNYRAPSEAGDLVGGNVNINFNVNVNNFAVDVVPSGRSAHQHYMPTVEYKARRSEGNKLSSFQADIFVLRIIVLFIINCLFFPFFSFVDPVVTLMKEMGTVRNVRFLREQNERIAALSRSSAKARTK